MVTKCRSTKGVFFKLMLQLVLTTLATLDTIVCSRTFKGNEIMAPLVDYKSANLTLIALLSKTPNKQITMSTERWFGKESGNKFVVFDFMDILLFQGTLAAHAFSISIEVVFVL
jgi:hypothetical protein